MTKKIEIDKECPVCENKFKGNKNRRFCSEKCAGVWSSWGKALRAKRKFKPEDPDGFRYYRLKDEFLYEAY